MNDRQDETIPESVIIIRFAAPSSTFVNVETKGVYPGQLIFVGEYLKHMGITLMEQQEEQKRINDEANKIIKPNSNLIVPR